MPLPRGWPCRAALATVLESTQLELPASRNSAPLAAATTSSTAKQRDNNTAVMICKNHQTMPIQSQSQKSYRRRVDSELRASLDNPLGHLLTTTLLDNPLNGLHRPGRSRVHIPSTQT